MLKLASFNIFPNVDMPEQIRRRVETRLDTTTASTLGNLFAQHGDDAVKSHEYSVCLSDICRYATSPDGYEVPIVNISGDDSIVGYSPTSKIFDFVAEVVSRKPNDMSLIETSYIISGYTSEADPSISGLLPSELVLYINDIHGIQTVYERFPTGGYGNPKQRNIDNYVLANVLSGYGNTIGSSELLVNPASIASTGVMVAGLELGDGESLDNTFFAPTIGTSVSGAQIYDSSITRPETLMSSVVSSYINHETAAGDNDDFTDTIFNSPYTSISRYVASTRMVCSFSGHEFVRALTAGLRGSVAGAERVCAKVETSARFTLGSFMSAIENPHDLTEQISSSLSRAKSNLQTLDTQETTDSWVGRNGYSTRGSVVAYEAAMRIGSIMSSNLIGKLQFAYDTTEAGPNNKPRFHIFPESVGSLSRSAVSMSFVQRMAKMVEMMMYQATEYGRLPVCVVVKAVLGVATRIEIRIDGEAWEYFTHASFMTSRLHIGMSNSVDYVNSLGKDAGAIYNEVKNGFSEFNRRSNIANISSFAPVEPTGAGILDQILSGGDLAPAPNFNL